ncbi:hypothetical protein J6590_043739 [Homalodisca vitripennis]|nr:hypothetical protein J6590_043739 [Homalodisca vitripennis]
MVRSLSFRAGSTAGVLLALPAQVPFLHNCKATIDCYTIVTMVRSLSFRAGSTAGVLLALAAQGQALPHRNVVTRVAPFSDTV